MTFFVRITVLVFMGSLALGACAHAPLRPAPLMRLDRAGASSLAREVQRDAPEAYAEFARALRRAEDAANGPREVLEERVAEAETTLAWAATQARGARARARALAAERRRVEAEVDATRMEQQAAEINAEVDARIAAQRALARSRDAASATASVPPPERAATAAELRQQAELLIAAAELLGAGSDALARARAQLARAEESGRGNDATAALVSAGRAFNLAEALVREARAGATPSQSTTDGAQLVADLSGAGDVEPRRDTRGVIVVMRGLFRGGVLAPTARGRLESMARVIRGHGDARVRVEAFVGGVDRARAERQAQAHAQAVVAELVRAGVPQERLQAAGIHRLPGGARSDDRVEIVLVLPTEP